eukprot:8339659-Prorocentrum_lima.AAC.1
MAFPALVGSSSPLQEAGRQDPREEADTGAPPRCPRSWYVWRCFGRHSADYGGILRNQMFAGSGVTDVR